MKKSAPSGTKTKTKTKNTFSAASIKNKQQQRLAAALDPTLHGRRAQYFISSWDKGSKAVRPQILEAFCLLHGESNIDVVETDLGDGAPLFFTRVTTWFRLSYKLLPQKETPAKKEEIAVTENASEDKQDNENREVEDETVTVLLWMIRTMAIFLKGNSYITLLCEGGVNGALTDCLDSENKDGSPALAMSERREIVLLLLFVANSGRVYRELVCDDLGLLQLLHALQRESAEEVSLLLIDLCVLLAQGIPKMSPLVHTAMMRVIYYSQPGMAARTLGAKQTRSNGTVLQISRAIRGMQLVRETQFYKSPDANSNLLPIVGLNVMGNADAYPQSSSEDPLMEEMTVEEYLETIMYLNLHDTNTSFRVEGNELLALAAKNTLLTARILNNCFDIMDDDLLVIADTDDINAIATRQRRQLSCGRAVVEIILSTPMTVERRVIILNLIAMRSAHVTLLKYLRMSDAGDVAAVLDCCKALQLLARAADEQQRDPERIGSNMVSLAKVGKVLYEAVGDSIYQVLLYQDISEEESFAVLRAARATAGAMAI